MISAEHRTFDLNHGINTSGISNGHRIALDHQRKCLNRAKQFFAAPPMYLFPRPKGLTLSPIGGDASSTPALVSLNKKNGSITVIGKGPGDGIVLRSSAVMDGRLGGDWAPTPISPITGTQVLFLSNLKGI